MGNTKKETRTEQIPIRFSRSEKDRVQKVAAMEQDYPATYLRKVVLRHLVAVTENRREVLAGNI